MNVIRFELNQKEIEVSDVPPTLTLLRYLRDEIQMKGTKEGCAEGDCGACTVVVLNEEDQSYRSINSCLLLVPMLHGKSLFTVEHLKQNGQYHRVQNHLAKNLGSQCGYCTPGVVMSLFSGCYRTDLEEEWQIDDQMCGNLCRCTGYRPIHDTALDVLGQRPQDAFLEYACTPSALKKKVSHSSLHYSHQGQSFFSPRTLDELWPYWQTHPNSLLVSGGTDLGLMITKRFEYPQSLISLESLNVLHENEITDEKWMIGSAVPLSKVESLAKTHCTTLERMLRFFGARQIKNRGTLGGNLCTASPIGDTSPVLLALNASVLLQSAQGKRSLPLKEFFTGYRQTALKDQEVLTHIVIPLEEQQTESTSTLRVESRAYKVSKRQELDISTVSAAFWIKQDEHNTIIDVRLAYGGMSATPVRATSIETQLIGQVLDDTLIDQSVQWIQNHFTPFSDHRGSAWYRSTVAGNLWRGFCMEINQNQDPRLPYRPTATVIV
jgi:xanthine dehydrogenase small subunit